MLGIFRYLLGHFPRTGHFFPDCIVEDVARGHIQLRLQAISTLKYTRRARA
jgi:hypothetical protein